MTILGIQLRVGLPAWITSQILALAVLCLTIYGFQIKSKRKSLALFALCSFFTIPMNILLENWIMVWFSIYFLFRNGIFYWLEIHGHKISKRFSYGILSTFSIAAVVMVSIVWTHWFDWLLLTGSLATGFGKWLRGTRGVHGMRIAKSYKCFLQIINSLMYTNFVSVMTQILTLSSIVIFYIRLSKNHKKPEPAIKNQLNPS
jgi:hypothetical protein